MQEIIAHGGLLAMAWYGGLGYVGTVLVLAVEPPLVTLLTASLYPQRGLAKHAWDLLKQLAVSIVVLFFIFATYAAALGDGQDAPGPPALPFEPAMVGWALGFLAFHLGLLLVYARTTPQPRHTWARLALNQAAVTFLALFFMVFVATFIGLFAMQALAPRWSASDVLVPLLVLLRLALAVLMTRMPEHELARSADNPYLD